MEELTLEQHNMNRETEERTVIERKIVNEVKRLQSELEQAKRLTDHTNHSADLLKQEVTNIESAIVDKKLQVERLVSEMKEANLQSLTVACQEEQIKNLLEGFIYLTLLLFLEIFGKNINLGSAQFQSFEIPIVITFILIHAVVRFYGRLRKNQSISIKITTLT